MTVTFSVQKKFISSAGFLPFLPSFHRTSGRQDWIARMSELHGESLSV